jgi:hypothetical protein
MIISSVGFLHSDKRVFVKSSCPMHSDFQQDPVRTSFEMISPQAASKLP